MMTEFAQAFGLTVVDAQIKACLVFGLTLLLLLCNRHAAASHRHLIAAGAIVTTMALFIITVMFPQSNVLGAIVSWQTVASVDSEPSISSFDRTDDGPTAEDWRPPAVAAQSKTTSEATAAERRQLAAPQSSTSVLPSDVTNWPTGLEVVCGLWLSGATILGFRLLVGLVGIYAISRKATSLNNQGWLADCKATLASLKIKRRVQLKMTDSVKTPMTWGCYSPIVLLPSDSETWEPRTRRTVLLHELAHVKRLDWITQTLAELACAVFWLNPLCWLVKRQMQVEQERSADDLVLREGVIPKRYAEELLHFVDRLTHSHLEIGGAVTMARKSTIELRLNSLLDANQNRGVLSRQRLGFSFLLVIMTVAGLSCWRVASVHAQDRVAAPAPQGKTGEANPKSSDAVDAEAKPSQVRTWKDNTGNFSVQAVFVSADNEKVTLRKADGKEIQVPLKRLSRSDRNWVRLRLIRGPAGGDLNAMIRSRLLAKSQLDFKDTPLADFAAALQKTHRIPIFINKRALEELGIGTDVPLSVKSNASLAEGIEAALKPLQLTYTVENEVLFLTTKLDAEQRLRHWVFSVKNNGNARAIQAEIMNKIDRESWDQVGGPGAAVATNNGILVVSQTYKRLLAIQRLFGDKLNRVNEKRGVVYPPGLELPKAALASKTTVNFVQTPLKDVAQYLTELHKIKIDIDNKALQDIGLNGDYPVTISLKNVSLRSALALMLKNLNLAWRPAGQKGLVITTPDQLERSLVKVKYPAGNRDRDALQELLKTIIQPDAWDEVGGRGSIKFEGNQMVIEQSVPVQFAVAALLDTVSRAK